MEQYIEGRLQELRAELDRIRQRPNGAVTHQAWDQTRGRIDELENLLSFMHEAQQVSGR